jgi:hypothetical protein
MGWAVNATPRPLYPRQRPGTHCRGGWVGPRVGLDGCWKSRPPPGFNPRTVQPIASRYTDLAISAIPGTLIATPAQCSRVVDRTIPSKRISKSMLECLIFLAARCACNTSCSKGSAIGPLWQRRYPGVSWSPAADSIKLVILKCSLGNVRRKI